MDHTPRAPTTLHAGQTTAWATARLWTRRLAFEPAAAVAGVGVPAVAIYFLYSYIREANEE